MPQLSATLKQQMDSRGWNLSNLEQKSGVSRTALRNIIENGATPELATLVKLGATLDIPLWRMVELCDIDLELGQSADERARRIAVLLRTMPQYGEVIDRLAQIDPRSLDSLLAFLDFQLQRQG